MDAYDAFVRHVNPALGRFLRLTGRGLGFVRAHGSVLEDAEGRRYDDWTTGCGSFNLGHNPEPLKRVMVGHLERDAPNLFHESLNPYAGELSAMLVEAAGPGFGTTFFCNSGSEAIEAAIKTSLLATGRNRIAHADGAYHGTTLGALACSGRGLYRDEFEAVLPGFLEVRFGDLDALERALSAGDVAAFLLELIQMEAGVRVASAEYLEGVGELCRRHGTLLVLDEVQTGMGTTGTLFGYQGYGIEPDILVLAKSLGGGMVPIGAAVMRGGLWDKAYGSFLRSEIHNTTFGGNALACAVALRTLELIRDPLFLERVRERGNKLFHDMTSALQECDAVERISWRGLLGGIKLREPSHPWVRWENMGLPELEGHPIAGALLVERLFRRGILAQICGHDWSVVRIQPPLTVDQETCDRFVDVFGEGVRWLQENN
jgi:acetylornithine/succinyldiaminopimelate/putrescine aminotransferase